MPLRLGIGKGRSKQMHGANFCINRMLFHLPKSYCYDDALKAAIILLSNVSLFRWVKNDAPENIYRPFVYGNATNMTYDALVSRCNNKAFEYHCCSILSII